MIVVLLQSFRMKQVDTRIFLSVVPNHLYLLDLQKKTWTELNSSRMTGNVPSARALHGMAVVDDRLYVFGGLYNEGAGAGPGTCPANP